mmetsp:Transcript_11835/g.30409  ORF Transcript_11835/g.30409 Transcript_11835/m.30409 type:complete len:561 (+) Transcript_11835:283-1965(+)
MAAFQENRSNIQITGDRSGVRLASVRRTNPLAAAASGGGTMAAMQEGAGEDDPYNGITVGARVFSTQYSCEGTVRFIGMHRSKGTPRVGIELDYPVGKLDGVQGGHRYFYCQPKFGILTNPGKVRLLEGYDNKESFVDTPAGEETPYGVTQKFGGGGGDSDLADMYMASSAVHEASASQAITLKSHSGNAAHVRDTGEEGMYAMMHVKPLSPPSSTSPTSSPPSRRAPRARRASAAAHLADVGRRITLEVESEQGGAAAAPRTPPRARRMSTGVVEAAKQPHIGPQFEAPGFVRGMSHDVVQRKVRGSLVGNYLIRESRAGDNLVLVVNENDQIANFTIYLNRSPAAISSAFVMQDHPASTLQELMRWARSNLKSYSKPGVLVPLGKPCSLEPWFAGDYTKPDVETAVLAGKQGEFLIRKSSDGRKYVVVVHDCGQAANFTVDPVPPAKTGKAAQEYCFGTLKFDTLDEVVAWLCTNSLRGLATEKLRVTDAAPFEGNRDTLNKGKTQRYVNVTMPDEHGYENVPKGGLATLGRDALAATPSLSPSLVASAGEEWGFGDD